MRCVCPVFRKHFPGLFLTPGPLLTQAHLQGKLIDQNSPFAWPSPSNCECPEDRESVYLCLSVLSNRVAQKPFRKCEAIEEMKMERKRKEGKKK